MLITRYSEIVESLHRQTYRAFLMVVAESPDGTGSVYAAVSRRDAVRDFQAAVKSNQYKSVVLLRSRARLGERVVTLAHWQAPVEIKVGDTVRVTLEKHAWTGKVGTVSAIHADMSSPYRVQFEAYKNAFYRRDEIEALGTEYNNWLDSLPADHEDTPRTESIGGGNPAAVLDSVRNIVDMAERIAPQGYVREETALELARIVVNGGCTADQILVGSADYGLSSVVHCVIFSTPDGMWHSEIGYIVAGRWHALDCAQHAKVETLRWNFTFNWREAGLYEVAI